MIIEEKFIRKIIRESIFREVKAFKKTVGLKSGSGRGSSSSASNLDVTQVRGNYPPENIKIVVKALQDAGMTNTNSIIGVCATIAKECNFNPRAEVGYANTSLDRIKQVFRNNTIHCEVEDIDAGTPFSTLSDDQISRLKSSNEKFFNALYGGWLGNNCQNDGWNYRGRGFIQLTGKANYTKAGYGSNPDAVNVPENAAQVVVHYMKDTHNNVWTWEELCNARTPEEGVNMAADKVSGKKNAARARGHAMARLEQFREMFTRDSSRDAVASADDSEESSDA